MKTKISNWIIGIFDLVLGIIIMNLSYTLLTSGFFNEYNLWLIAMFLGGLGTAIFICGGALLAITIIEELS